ncbi:hypothetical protein JCGZ_14194 [Jatropha curcas]|uniref:Uncharacterized protein n=1 Tax=Jatropha curcas TaxID=180498 RepID=A0A067K048_JATCU|nr:hypothetical protein JCGZ_14194 [Jatropha curcas]
MRDLGGYPQQPSPPTKDHTNRDLPSRDNLPTILYRRYSFAGHAARPPLVVKTFDTRHHLQIVFGSWSCCYNNTPKFSHTAQFAPLRSKPGL